MNDWQQTTSHYVLLNGSNLGGSCHELSGCGTSHRSEQICRDEGFSETVDAEFATETLPK